MDILDNLNVIKQHDPEGALDVIGQSAEQATWEAKIEQDDGQTFQPKNFVLAGMGGSALGALIAKNWLDRQYNLNLPFEIVRDYTLPNYVGPETLVICFSVSGNTEETVSSLNDAIEKGARVVIIASGGKLIDLAYERNLPFVQLGQISQPRYGVIMHLRAITCILAHYGSAEGAYDEIASLTEEIAKVAKSLAADIPTADNQAKQLALHCAGKTPIVYASSLFAPLAYKWKIGFNENAKNTAWWNQLPEFSHNEFIGWASHPVEKPFAILDLRSNLDNPRIAKRFELTEKLLSGRRPAAREIWLQSDSLLGQMLTGMVLADFTSIYLAILNGVDPTPVDLVEKLKKELA